MIQRPESLRFYLRCYSSAVQQESVKRTAEILVVTRNRAAGIDGHSLDSPCPGFRSDRNDRT